MEFEYDPKKNEANIDKHGISLVQGSTVFRDDNYLDFVDERHDYGEERRIRVGVIPLPPVERRVIVVVYTRRGDKIRIISARKANDREQLRYHNR